MNFKTDLIQKMLDNGLSQSSIKNYIRNVEILNDDRPFKNLTFLKDKENIINKISSKKPNTQRSYLISIVSVLKYVDDDKYKKLLDYYYDQMMDMNKTLKEEASKNIKTETQKENWITKEEIDEKLKELENTVKSYKPKDMINTEYNKVLQMIVLSLYVLQAPRRNADYQYMIVVKDKVSDDKINFLVYDKKEFWFRKYKTSKTELKDKNELVVPINDKMMTNINLYFKFHPLIHGKKITNSSEEIPFLVNFYGEPLLQVNSITYIINKIFGKNIGSSMMRHLYTSHKYGDLLEEQKKDAEQMSHSLGQQKEYIKN
jgi:hypothetical protein